MSIPVATRTEKDPDGSESVTMVAQCLPPYHTPELLREIVIPYQGNTRLFEAITPNSTKNHRVWKPFQHYKCWNYDQNRWSSMFYVTAGQPINSANLLDIGVVRNRAVFHRWQLGPYGQFNSGLDSWYQPQPDGSFITVPDDLEDLKCRGLKAMIPKIKADLAILVSVWEARDILSIKGWAKRSVKMAKWINHKLLGRSKKPIAKTLVRQGADSYLQWMFNVKPLISDICGIYHAVSTYQKRINALVNRSGTLQKAHFKCDLHDSLLPQVWKLGADNAFTYYCEGSSYWAPVIYDPTREVIVDKAEFRCSMQYNYTFTAFQVQYQKILGLLDMLGDNFSPSYIWNVLPWSFVVDWVINVSEWLDQFAVKNMEPRVNILQYCWSILKERRIEVGGPVRASSSLYGGSIGPQYVHLPTVYESSYRRGIDLPQMDSFVTSGLSSTELSLGAALLTTRRRRNTKRN